MPKKVPSKKKTARRVWPGWVVISVVVVVLAAAALIFYLTGGAKMLAPAPTPTSAPSAEMSVDDALGYLGGSVIFLDVRPAVSWNAFHIDQSVNIPIDQLSGHLSELSHSRHILIFDANGEGPASQAYDILKQAGYTRIAWVNGGMDAWVQKHYPIVGYAPY